jgi:hypothetical protein
MRFRRKSKQPLNAWHYFSRKTKQKIKQDQLVMLPPVQKDSKETANPAKRVSGQVAHPYRANIGSKY